MARLKSDSVRKQQGFPEHSLKSKEKIKTTYGKKGNAEATPDDIAKMSEEGQSSNSISNDEEVVPYKASFRPSPTPSKKRKRGQNNALINPFGDHLRVTYSVKRIGTNTKAKNDVANWSSLKRHKSFKVKSTEIKVNQQVYIRSANNDLSENGYLDEAQLSDYWVAHICDCRGNSKTEVYLLVYWLYRLNDLPTAPKQDSKPTRCGEVFPSNHLEVIDVGSVAAPVLELKHFSLQEIADLKKDDDPDAELIWYRTYDCFAPWEPVAEPKICVKCKKYDLLTTGNLVFCNQCRSHTHKQCLIDYMKERAQYRHQLKASHEERMVPSQRRQNESSAKSSQATPREKEPLPLPQKGKRKPTTSSATQTPQKSGPETATPPSSLFGLTRLFSTKPTASGSESESVNGAPGPSKARAPLKAVAKTAREGTSSSKPATPLQHAAKAKNAAAKAKSAGKSRAVVADSEPEDELPEIEITARLDATSPDGHLTVLLKWRENGELVRSREEALCPSCEEEF